MWIIFQTEYSKTHPSFYPQASTNEYQSSKNKSRSKNLLWRHHVGVQWTTGEEGWGKGEVLVLASNTKFVCNEITIRVYVKVFSKYLQYFDAISCIVGSDVPMFYSIIELCLDYINCNGTANLAADLNLIFNEKYCV